jgi:hypothetical protein
MSIFVELPPDQYSPAAFANFDPSTNAMTLGNALALMWMSQLAYEADRQSTLDAVAPKWAFSPPQPFIRQKTGVPDSFDTSGLVAERADAVVMAFAGTDPGVWQTLATDTDAKLDAATDTHTGFQAAVNAVRDVIEQAVDLSKQTGKPLWMTGHSLGAALAVLAAQYADTLQRAPKAVYLFGMPRAGGVHFQATYNGNANLGLVSYRFVHGLDVVARVPPSINGYRHIGRVLQCDSGKRFDPATSPLSALGSDDPQLEAGILATVESTIENVLAGHLFSPPGPGTFGPLFKFLPQPLRDHLQDRYWTALTPA